MVFNDKIFLGSTKDVSFFSSDGFYNEKKKRKQNKKQNKKQKMGKGPE